MLSAGFALQACGSGEAKNAASGGNAGAASGGGGNAGAASGGGGAGGVNGGGGAAGASAFGGGGGTGGSGSAGGSGGAAAVDGGAGTGGSSGAPPVKAFPSAEGAGANAIGGRGGKVVEITNLEDSGPGSFRACAEGTDKRICVFRVGGTIALDSDIVVKEPNSFLTVAAHTAPGSGIQLKNWGLVVTSGAHDVVVRYLKIRKGTDQSPQDINNDCNGILIWSKSAAGPTRDVIIDHASVSWICDDTVQTYSSATNVTVQWSIVGEGLVPSDYKTSAGKGAQSKGGLVAGSGQWKRSYHHNLYIHSGSRNPYTKGQAAALPTLDWRNNLVYNWSGCQAQVAIGEYNENGTQGNDASVRVNFVGNSYVAGPDTNTGAACGLGQFGGKGTKMFIQDNIGPFCKNGCSSLPDMKFFHQPTVMGTPPPYAIATDTQFRADTPFAVPAVETMPASSLEAVLVKTGGAYKPVRDPLDARLINELQTRTGNLGRNGEPWPALAGGTPPTDTDADGMPDAWETSHGLDPKSSGDGAKTSKNGYTNVENYLNELADDVVPPW